MSTEILLTGRGAFAPMDGMIAADESLLLAEDEGPAVEVLNPTGAGGILLVCEHASRFIPRSLRNLGLDAEAEASHAAWDIGALELARALSAALDAPLVAARVSRLVYDCNRPPDAPDAIPARSERFGVPGNAALSAAERGRRVAAIYAPFRQTLAETLAGLSGIRALVTIHSFTPVFHGVARTVELGILHDSDPRLAELILTRAQNETALATALNQPYAAADGVTHTLRAHAIPTGLPNVMIEVRNDLIDSSDGVARIAGDLVALLRGAIDSLPPSAASGDMAAR